MDENEKTLPFNAGKSYGGQVKPSGFLVAFMARGVSAVQFETIPRDEPQGGRSSKQRNPRDRQRHLRVARGR